MSTPANLIDDQGAPIRWKAATLISLVALVVTLVLSIAKAGAKSERLDATVTRVEKLEVKIAIVDKLETREEDVRRRLAAIEGKLDELLKRRTR